MTTLCLKCGLAPTIDAHIFPKAVVRAFRKRGPDKKTMAVFADRAVVANTQNGIFDKNILCAECDGEIGEADKWFAESIDVVHSYAANRKPFEVIAMPIDARVAIQFAVSVIYRASLSGLEHFASISLGPYSQIAGEISVDSYQADFIQPFVMINALTSEYLDVRQFAFYPVRCLNGNGPFFVFTVSGIQFLVKFGGRVPGIGGDDRWSSGHRVCIGTEPVVCCYPFDESAEAHSLRATADRSKTR